ncbi:unnamed protein product [Hermetia illucens]|uniref:Mutator-like transposase domain-containing protein n=1 Tax=Hermetia illucens TaxID=343691 RepID=A0A7R8UE69_HERIL|nr:unnamed protein product [Hermetia illucens]
MLESKTSISWESILISEEKELRINISKEISSKHEHGCSNCDKFCILYIGFCWVFSGISANNKIYVVVKKECVGHVEKRMGMRLRNAKKNHKGIGGKGAEKLTDKVINDLATFFGLAIRRHANSIEGMK